MDGGAGEKKERKTKSEVIRNDLSETELSREDTQDGAKWRRLIYDTCIDPTSK